MSKRNRSGSERSDQDATGAGPAPGDLLALWISGLDAGAGEAHPEAEAAPEPVAQEQASDLGEAPGEADPDQATPDQATPDEAAPDEAAPDEATTDEATTDQPSSEAGPSYDSVSDESGWHDDVEHEWIPEPVDQPQSVETEQAEPVAAADPEQAESVADAAPQTEPISEEPTEQVEQVEQPTEQVETGAGTDGDGQPLTAQETPEHEQRGWASFGAARTAEDVLARVDTPRPWSDEGTLPLAEAASQDLQAGPHSKHEEAVEQPVGPMSAQADTAQWTLDDLEEYAQARSEAEATTEPGSAETDEPDPADATAEADGGDPEPKQGVRGLLARIGLVRDHGEDQSVEEPEAEPEPEPEAQLTSGQEPQAISVPEPAESSNLWPEEAGEWATEDDAAGSYEDRWGTAETEPEADPGGAPDTATAGAAQSVPEAAVEPSAGVEHEQPTLFAEPNETDDPDRTQYFDWVIEDADQPRPAEAEESAPEPGPAAAPVEAESSDSTEGSEPAQAYQEWFDDHGLRWTSDDGGYTWFADDGQGWNAETGEPIDNPRATARQSTLPATEAEPEPPAASTADAPAESPEPEPVGAEQVTQAGQWPEPDPEVEAPEAKHVQAGDLWPTATGPVDLATLRQRLTSPDGGQAGVAHPAAESSGEASAGTFSAPALEDDGPDIPQYVEYKPRGAYRPLLGVLFVAAALLAVVAIFWAVSKGSQAATGIATGVTGFALAFWWGLLSWTPTVVSLHGSMLEVTRGSEGERFELTSPKLVIDVDDDTGSRNWRTTITRPNGTELVIPASAVDPDEFTAIVQHYRAGVQPAS